VFVLVNKKLRYCYSLSVGPQGLSSQLPCRECLEIVTNGFSECVRFLYFSFDLCRDEASSQVYYTVSLGLSNIQTDALLLSVALHEYAHQDHATLDGYTE
jgi:hypothetical protein